MTTFAHHISGQRKTVRLLLIEDDMAQAELIRLGLTNGYSHIEVDHVANGREALEHLQRFASPESEGRPDLVLLDLRLPGLSGHELLEKVKGDDLLKIIPIVVLSTSSSEEDRMNAYRLGANGYVAKPLDHLRFREMLHDLVTYWCDWNEPVPVG